MKADTSLKLAFLLMISVWAVRTQASCTTLRNGVSNDYIANSVSYLNLKKAFISSAEYTTQLNTNWASDFSLLCSGIFPVTLYYHSATGSGFAVEFIDKSKGLDQWITFIATPQQSSVVNSPGTHDFSGKNIDYRLTAKLGKSGEDFTQANGNRYQLLTVALSDYDKHTPAWLRSYYNKDTGVKGYALLDVTYDPDATTCTIDNQTFVLPAITLGRLQRGETASSVYPVAVNCQGVILEKTTRSVTARLYSNDLIDGGSYIIRNQSSTSAGVGFQLFNDKNDPLIFSSSEDRNATVIWRKEQNSAITGDEQFLLGARYKLYDEKKFKPGTVTGTVIAWFEYD
ncbi:hypothetical protein C7M52_00155 [Mixta theicola]|nr:fimbrial protein [Mixta theicola]QHM74232.1 hypothetical protein C7M52_00155 [Mixta theicola]